MTQGDVMKVVNLNKDVAITETNETKFPEVLKEFYFMDSQQVEPYPKWFRTPYIRGDQLATYLAEFDPTTNEDLRIQSMFDLYQMVNDQGMNKQECEDLDIEFAPYCQKAVWIFGKRYEIKEEIFELLKKGSGDIESNYLLPKSKTSFSHWDIDDEPKVEDVTWVTLDVSLMNEYQKRKIEELTEKVNESFLKKGGKGKYTSFSGICLNLLEHGLRDISDWDEDEESFLGEITEGMYIPKMNQNN